MLSYRKLAMRVLGRPLHTGGGNDSPRPASQRAAAFILTAALLTGAAFPAFAGTYHIEEGDIVISAGTEAGTNKVEQGGTLKSENDTGTIITGTSNENTVTIDTSEGDVDVTFDDLKIDVSGKKEGNGSGDGPARESKAAVTVQADVSTAEGCKKLFEEAVNAFGRVDILVNNAGVTRDNLILRLSEEDFDTVLNANLKGAFLCCKEAARRMVRQRYGRIVNLSSVVGLRGNAGQTNYSASKAGLIGLTKSLAKELASRNVTVNAVAPGFIATDMTAALPEAVRTEMCKTIPEGHAGQPEDVANAVAFFAAEQSSYLTGQVLCVDGGMAM